MTVMLKKISFSKTKPFLVFLLLFLSFSLTVGKEYLHNHKPNEPERDDCPALIISQSFSSGITVHFELPSKLKVEVTLDNLQLISEYQSVPITNCLRGPPLV